MNHTTAAQPRRQIAMIWCEEHKQTPAKDFEPGAVCYGDLFFCDGCERQVCAGYGAADGDPDLCDGCWAKKHNK